MPGASRAYARAGRRGKLGASLIKSIAYNPMAAFRRETAMLALRSLIGAEAVARLTDRLRR